jgi:hypothetical protein
MFITSDMAVGLQTRLQLENTYKYVTTLVKYNMCTICIYIYIYIFIYLYNRPKYPNRKSDKFGPEFYICLHGLVGRVVEHVLQATLPSPN